MKYELFKAFFRLLVEFSNGSFQLSVVRDEKGVNRRVVPVFVLLRSLFESFWIGEKGNFSSILFQVTPHTSNVPKQLRFSPLGLLIRIH